MINTYVCTVTVLLPCIDNPIFYFFENNKHGFFLKKMISMSLTMVYLEDSNDMFQVQKNVLLFLLKLQQFELVNFIIKAGRSIAKTISTS